jgi:hypothetical protein
MKTLAGLLMVANAAIFFFGGVQHAGITVGRFHEPLIIPAAIVEAVRGLCLLWGAIALFRSSRTRWRLALITNLIALGGEPSRQTWEARSATGRRSRGRRDDHLSARSWRCVVVVLMVRKRRVSQSVQ